MERIVLLIALGKICKDDKEKLELLNSNVIILL